MSHELDKIHHSERIHQKKTKIKKQVNIAKAYHTDSKWKYLKEPHRNHKTHIFNFMKYRKSFGTKSIQELRFDQPKLHEELSEE